MYYEETGFFICHVFPTLHLTAKILTPYTLYQTGSAVHLPVLMEYVWTTRTPLTVTVLTLLTLALTVSMLDVSYFRGVQFGEGCACQSCDKVLDRDCPITGGVWGSRNIRDNQTH